jgi:predicted HTH domain antitoxin
MEFQRVLADREIPIRYDWEEDLAALKKWRGL